VKAVVWHGVGDIRLDDVPEPTIQDPTDGLVEITASATCGTDLRFVRGTMSGMVEGTILGHEAVGVVRETGPGVRNLRPDELPIGAAMNENLTVTMGNCSHRAYVPHLLDLVRTGAIDPSTVFIQVGDMPWVLDAYGTFDRRESGWTEVVLDPSA
jgi:threonine dehydrogenase-like Zn-dependent dehydrogenase